MWKRLERIPKQCLSEKYGKLPVAKRLSLMRQMNQQALRLFEETEKSAKEATEFNEKLFDTLQALNAGQPIKINLFQEKETRHTLSEEMKKHSKALKDFQKSAEQGFYDFRPEVSKEIYILLEGNLYRDKTHRGGCT